MADILFWSDLRQCLDSVLVEQQMMSICDYMKTSIAVNTYLKEAKAKTAVEEVQLWVVAYVNGHLAVIARRMLKLEHGPPLIAAYVAQWQYFAQASQAMSGCLGQTVGIGMREAMVQAWYTTVFRRIAASMAAAMVALVDGARKDGGVDDPQLLSNLSCVLVDLRPTHAPELPRGELLGVYFAWYLEPYVWAAVRHIDSCTSHLRTPGSTREYIRLVTRLIDDEERRAVAYLRPESVESLRCVLAQRFVAGSLAAIHAEAELMLATDDEDLRSVFCLLRRVPADRVAMQPLCDVFRAYVTQHTLAAMPSLAELNPNDASVSSLAFARNAVDWLIAELNHLRAMTTRCFDDDPRFSNSLVAGLREALNSKDFMGSGHPQLEAPRLLAGYFGLLLQADSALALELAAAHPTGFENAVESRAREALQLCELVNGKDKLTYHYRSLLARRLVTDSSSSVDLERTVVAMLTPLTGIDSTNRINDMIEDMNLSHTLFADYRPSVSSGSLDVSVKVLRENLWCGNLSSELSRTMIVPRQVSAACEEFIEMYKSRYNSAPGKGRKLQWLWAYSKATIQLYFPHSVGRVAQTGYTIVVNTYQLAILALFTDASCLGSAAQQLTPAEISLHIKLHPAAVKSELAVLARAGILVSNKSNDAVMMNSSFNSRRLRIDVSGIKRMRQETVAETTKIDSYVDSERYLQIQSAIMTEMKRRLSIHHTKLLNFVTTRFERVFPVERPVFKRVIGVLITDRYIRQKEGDFNIYEYIA
ncbi:hypothetical protein GGH94_005108 [Coemansia aciculifera]|uniref:Cullin family profile domain-containing protein n=1 Tax=Coemansia aciculifera TaxID=417176 RepID=A0A9W8IJ41_9FUNG|nr:hypothetical protein GGH94_005108 [Coemansia aciculifera]KAJ2872484.1 hypothetical protein GGH93_003998 [Coemansia aciculifera]